MEYGNMSIKPEVNIQARETIPKLFEEIDLLREAVISLTDERDRLKRENKIQSYTLDMGRNDLSELRLLKEQLKIAVEALEKIKEREGWTPGPFIAGDALEKIRGKNAG